MAPRWGGADERAILAFNLLPAFPLDGGRVARALLWWRRGDITAATTTAAAIGRGLGYGMIGIGIFGFAAGAFGGLWLALIGLFVIAAAKAEENVGEDQDVAELLERPAFGRVGRAAVVTADGGIGLLSISDVNRMLRALELSGAPPLQGAPRV